MGSNYSIKKGLKDIVVLNVKSILFIFYCILTRKLTQFDFAFITCPSYKKMLNYLLV